MRSGIISAHQAVSEGVYALLDAGRAAEHQMRLFTDTDSARVKEAMQDVAAAIGEYDVASAVEDGARRFAEGEPDGG